MRDAQHKMSKRNGDPSYEDLKAQGYLTPAILNYVALLGWSPRGEQSEQEFFTLDELVGAFDIGGISKSPAIFDIDKLTYFNSEYLRAMTPEQFAAVAAEPFIRQSVKNEAYSAAEIAPLLQHRCEVLTTFPKRSISSTRCRSMILRSTRTRNPRPTLPSRSRCCRRSSQSSRR